MKATELTTQSSKTMIQVNFPLKSCSLGTKSLRMKVKHLDIIFLRKEEAEREEAKRKGTKEDQSNKWG